jgi:hypothetical protein
MTIARIIGIAGMFALAVGIASFDPIYAASPCCTLKDGTWIVIKTGKPASPAQIKTFGLNFGAPPKADAAPKPAGSTATDKSGGGGGPGHK